jgi:hypothetical protein
VNSGLGILGIMTHITEDVAGIHDPELASIGKFMAGAAPHGEGLMQTPPLWRLGQFLVALETDLGLGILKTVMVIGFRMNPCGKENQNHDDQNV